MIEIRRQNVIETIQSIHNLSLPKARVADPLAHNMPIPLFHETVIILVVIDITPRKCTKVVYWDR